ncbi:TPM domain-containing protein [Lysobacter solisilvae (ex Woo and Kim 2020)]|uniref:TPM domain-containing protein n=1 Tax=Agrilutibacter terrestris TaxID=2865112 RepID=A0A7H0G1A9_9GAMM|nr:TPM domain-containing protein [Lysobacter terrestris]QNP42075.1 TPM domain-containing protein [Lysobacter terrestris]
MRRLVALACLLLACAVAQAQQLAAIPPLTGPVIDTTMTLDAATKQQLEAQALALQQRKGSQLQVLIVPSTEPEDIAQYAVRAFGTYKLGREGTSDGVLLVVAKTDRRAWIATGYGLEGAIPDATAYRVVQEYLLPRFRAGDFNGGVIDATGQLVKLIDGEQLPAPLAQERPRREGRGSDFLFALFAAFIVAQVARAFLNPVPSFLRGILGGAAAGGVAWLISSLALVGGLGGVIGFLVGLASMPSGRHAGHGGWGGFGGGGGGWGGGGFGGGGGGFGGGGGGWSGGGGMTGGGGAGGSW